MSTAPAGFLCLHEAALQLPAENKLPRKVYRNRHQPKAARRAASTSAGARGRTKRATS